jgi:hypothetical protein
MIYNEQLGNSENSISYLPILAITWKVIIEGSLLNYTCAWSREPFKVTYRPDLDRKFGDKFIELIKERPLQVGDILIPSKGATIHDDGVISEIGGVLYMSDILAKGIPVYLS